MRAVAVLSAVLAVVFLAGPALASDYMLPVLLNPQHPGATPSFGEGAPSTAQSLPPPAQATGTSMTIALLGAAAVTIGTLLVLGRKSGA